MREGEGEGGEVGGILVVSAEEGLLSLLAFAISTYHPCTNCVFLFVVSFLCSKLLNGTSAQSVACIKRGKPLGMDM